jgi:hypothetical protein
VLFIFDERNEFQGDAFLKNIEVEDVLKVY